MTAWAIGGGSYNALKFTPVEYPVTIMGGSINIGDGTYPHGGDNLQPFNLLVFDDDGEDGMPGTLVGTFEIEPTAFGWVGFDIYRPGAEIVFDDGDFISLWSS